MRVVFVPEGGVEVEGNAVVLVENASTAQALEVMRAYHAENAWHDELEYPTYAVQHYEGLAAMARLQCWQGDGYPITVVPVQFGVLVAL